MGRSAIFIHDRLHGIEDFKPTEKWVGSRGRRPSNPSFRSFTRGRPIQQRQLQPVDFQQASASNPLQVAVQPGRRILRRRESVLRHDLHRVGDAWDDCQASRDRNAIYGYLTAVYGLVAWWAADGRDVDRASPGAAFAATGSL